MGGVDGELHLFERRFEYHIIRLFTAQQPDSAGVHQRKGPAAPFGFGADAVAGDAGLIVDDGDAAPDDAVEERGLADVWPANNGNQSWHGLNMRHEGGRGKRKVVAIIISPRKEAGLAR